MKKINIKLFDILIVLISIVLSFYFYGNVIKSPNSYMFNSSGDGLKNYYTYAYHIKNDSSYTEFEGMNYPYGEHFFYTDSHPIVTVVVQSLSKIFPNIVYYSIGIINFLMILSIFLTYIALFYLLKQFKISNIISLIGAMAIGMLAPQLFRLTGHYALSYSLAIPLTWLLLLKYYKNNKKIHLLFLMLNNVFWILIHAYLGIIIIGFVFFYYLFDLILKIKINLKKISKHLVFILSVFLPILIYLMILFFTDNHLNRTNNPSGFFQYNAEIDDILLPHFGFIKINIEKFIKIKQHWEGWAYVGIVSSMFFVFLLFSFIYNLIKRRINKFTEKYINNESLRISLYSSIMLLLFSFGVPFKQFPFLINIFPIFKQFRATGRFDWVFYFVFLIIVFSIINTLYTSFLKSKKIYAYVFLLLVTILYFYDGWVQQSYVSSKIILSENIFKQSYKDKLKPSDSDINFSAFQAIIPMPFYHFGSEVFSVSGLNEIEKISMIYSYHYNLPMMSAYLTRVSIPESKKIISILSPTFYKKDIKKDIKNNNPFLIIETKEKKSEYEKEIIKRSEFLFSHNGYKFYKISPNKLLKYTAKNDISNFEKIKNNKLVYKNGFYLSDTTKYYYFNDFEYTENKIKYRGKGSGKVNKNKKNIIIEFPPNTFSKENTYNISFWVYNAENNLNEHFRFCLNEYNNQEIVSKQEFYPEYSQVINKNWSKVEFNFKVKNTNNNIKLYSKGSIYSGGIIYYDDILIYEYPLKIYKILNKENGETKELFFNNNMLK